jgi:G3E family GTPase
MLTVSRLPVTVPFGFLIGKPTSLDHLLADREDLRVAVIVNDASEVDIDASRVDHRTAGAGPAVSRTDEKLVQLSRDCVCRTQREATLVEARKLAAERRIDRLLAESIGIRQRMPVAATLGIGDDQRTLAACRAEQIEFADVLAARKRP